MENKMTDLSKIVAQVLNDLNDKESILIGLVLSKILTLEISQVELKNVINVLNLIDSSCNLEEVVGNA